MGLTQYLIMTVDKIIIAKETRNRFIHNDIMCSEKDGRMNKLKFIYGRRPIKSWGK